MTLFNWDSRLEVGIKEMDTQHQRLIALVNELHDAMKAGKSKDVMGKTFKSLVEYTIYHFQAEEKILTQQGYPALPKQKLAHTDLIDQVKKLELDFAAGKFTITMELMKFLQNWVTTHIMGEDKLYGPYLKGKGLS